MGQRRAVSGVGLQCSLILAGREHNPAQIFADAAYVFGLNTYAAYCPLESPGSTIPDIRRRTSGESGFVGPRRLTPSVDGVYFFHLPSYGRGGRMRLKFVLLTLTALIATPFAHAADADRPAARAAPDWLRDGVVYEVFPRVFSP